MSEVRKNYFANIRAVLEGVEDGEGDFLSAAAAVEVLKAVMAMTEKEVFVDAARRVCREG